MVTASISLRAHTFYNQAKFQARQDVWPAWVRERSRPHKATTLPVDGTETRDMASFSKRPAPITARRTFRHKKTRTGWISNDALTGEYSTNREYTESILLYEISASTQDLRFSTRFR